MALGDDELLNSGESLIDKREQSSVAECEKSPSAVFALDSFKVAKFCST